MPPRVLFSVMIIDAAQRVTLDSRDEPITYDRLVAALRFGRQQQQQQGQGQTLAPPSADPIFQFTDEDRETISFSSQREIGEVMRAAKRMNDRRKQLQQAAAAEANGGSAAQSAGAHDDDEFDIVPLHIRVLQPTNQAQGGDEEFVRMEHHDVHPEHAQRDPTASSSSSSSSFVLLDSAGEEAGSARDTTAATVTPSPDDVVASVAKEVTAAVEEVVEAAPWAQEAMHAFSFDSVFDSISFMRKMAPKMHQLLPLALLVVMVAAAAMGAMTMRAAEGMIDVSNAEPDYPIAVRAGGSVALVAPEMHAAQAAIAQMVLNLHHKIAKMEAREAAWRHEQQRAELRRLKEEEARANQPLARLGAAVNEGVEVVADKMSHMPEHARQQAARLRVVAAEARSGLESLGEQLTGKSRAWEDKFHSRMATAADAVRQVGLLLDDTVREVNREVEERSAPALHDARIKWQQAQAAAGRFARASWSAFVDLIHKADAWMLAKNTNSAVEWQQPAAAKCANARRAEFLQAQSDAREQRHGAW